MLGIYSNFYGMAIVESVINHIQNKFNLNPRNINAVDLMTQLLKDSLSRAKIKHILKVH